MQNTFKRYTEKYSKYESQINNIKTKNDTADSQ